jgi:hypothetical protein
MSSLANPYAPPGTALVSPPTSALPPGFRRFRLDPIRFRAFATRAILKRAAFVGGIALIFSLGYAAVLPGVREVVAVAPLVLVIALVPAFLRVRRGTSAELLSYELLVTPRVLRREVAGAMPAEILRPEVTRIVETKAGLWVSSQSPRRSLFVARVVDGYADVRAELATWRAIEPLSGAWATWRLTAESSKEQGCRDGVHGTSLAADASLREELEIARTVSSAAYLAHPVAPPPRRRRPVMTLALWVVLIVMFLAIWQFLTPAPPRSTSRPRAHPTSAE